MTSARKIGKPPAGTPGRSNISTENQPEGAARRPSDTLDREPKRDPESGASLPDDYNPASGTRIGEEADTRAGREGQGQPRKPRRKEL
ncbi:hypothetical protein [Sphingopyxis terrae]|uniref:Uncharacterized protein n=1 Tax=Sphingopyxis terrae subsp. ummariensis TaxID=429001 RepID=A0A1Y6FNY4_9SPHN|nr:hypothetical protein [Sphingopyxis terrae]PCF90968.1 hypothetical protein CPA46_10940 [Sphingopyxis terrae subsp. ummariensis]SMQ76417.1 hypothetical protein SAMN06295984_1856 [Sphingopyxis terrae subsp. ummariensis]